MQLTKHIVHTTVIIKPQTSIVLDGLPIANKPSINSRTNHFRSPCCDSFTLKLHATLSGMESG